jgi:hypothetical protein
LLSDGRGTLLTPDPLPQVLGHRREVRVMRNRLAPFVLALASIVGLAAFLADTSGP